MCLAWNRDCCEIRASLCLHMRNWGHAYKSQTKANHSVHRKPMCHAPISWIWGPWGAHRWVMTQNLCYNCFIGWVLNRIDQTSDARCTGRQHSEKHSQTQLLLNGIRDLCANVPCCSDLHSSWCLTKFWCSTNIEESRCAFVQFTMNLSMSCFQTKLHENMFQFRADFLWMDIQRSCDLACC